MSRFICLFCNGKACKYEDYRQWQYTQDAHPAIHGLHSNWVSDTILAMARPSERGIAEFAILEQFKTKSITAIINLQQAGEHAGCGDGLVPDGDFSYRPETFMDIGVSFYNFGWKDMTTPTIQLMMNIVQVVAFTIETGGRVAVHCHAGLGRTGLVIACYLVYGRGYLPGAAIADVRTHRPGSIQTRRQEAFISHFHLHITRLRRVFATPSQAFGIGFALQKQREFLHGLERRQLLFIPKLVHEVCARLTALLVASTKVAATALAMLECSSVDTGALSLMKETLNDGQWQRLSAVTDVSLLARLLLDWLIHLKEPVLSVEEATAIVANPTDVTQIWSQLSPSSRAIVNCIAGMLHTVSSVPAMLRTRLSCLIVAVLAPNTVHGAFGEEHFAVTESVPGDLRMLQLSEQSFSAKCSDIATGVATPSPELRALARFLMQVADTAAMTLPRGSVDSRTQPQLLRKSSAISASSQRGERVGRSSSLAMIRSHRRPATAAASAVAYSQRLGATTADSV